MDTTHSNQGHEEVTDNTCYKNCFFLQAVKNNNPTQDSFETLQSVTVPPSIINDRLEEWPDPRCQITPGELFLSLPWKHSSLAHTQL